MSYPLLLATDERQNIFDVPGFQACRQTGELVTPLLSEDLLPLPAGSNLFFLPDRYPVGYNVRTQILEGLRNFFPVAAFLAPGYTSCATVAYFERRGAQTLPLFSYAPVAFWKGRFYVPAVKVDSRKNHDLHRLDRKRLETRIGAFRKTRNRLIQHLADCARINSCPNAINFFLGKYEAPLPVSPSCNARCLGCISLQPEGSCPATQPRLSFIPAAGEIAEIALWHIRNVQNPVVSFGQGCEGEPLMQAEVIGEAIRLIRAQTIRGTIHMNTNASLSARVDALCKAGLDSVRVSLNSAQPELYERYYAPRGYGFSDVCCSIRLAKRRKKFVALNYLVMPGFTDRAEEFQAFRRLVQACRVDMVQWRNLNYDPRRYFERMRIADGGRLLGVRTVIERLRTLCPWVRHGYFNLPKACWGQRR